MQASVDYMPALMQRLQAPHLDPQQAIGLLADAAEEHPEDARPLLLLAAEYMELRDLDRAEAAYVAALLRAPAFPIARFQLGLLQFTSGRPVVALTTWAPLAALPDGDPLRLFTAAFECLARNDFGPARTLLLEGIAANTSNPPLNNDMRMLLQRIDEQQASLAPGDAGPAPDGDHFLVSAYGKH